MQGIVTPIRITLREARQKAGLTQVQLAELADVRPATISDLESEKRSRVDRRLIDLDVIERICRVLHLDPGDLLVLDPPLDKKGPPARGK